MLGGLVCRTYYMYMMHLAHTPPLSNYGVYELNGNILKRNEAYNLHTRIL